MERGQCGFTAQSVEDNMDGRSICTMKTTPRGEDLSGNMTLVVLRWPGPPQLQLNGTGAGGATYVEGQTMRASCTARESRLPANINWYLDDESTNNEKITEDLDKRQTVCDKESEVCFASQSISRRLKDTDNGRNLSCFISHLLRSEGVGIRLDVTYDREIKVRLTIPFITVDLGQPVRVLCEVDIAITECWILVPSGALVSLAPGRSDDMRLSYPSDASMERGQCGFTAPSTEDNMDGNFVCTMRTRARGNELSGNATVVVCRAPDPPQLHLNGEGAGGATYVEGQVILATCTAHNARPSASISWYLDNEEIADGVGEPEVESLTGLKLNSLSLTFSRPARDSDNGRALSCSVRHPVREHRALAVLDIRYPPKQAEGTLNYASVVEGQKLEISVIVVSNPRPKFSWDIGQIHIEEGQLQTRFYAKPPVQLNGEVFGRWQTNLTIDIVTKEDSQRKFVLTASNILGMEKYEISISMRADGGVSDIGLLGDAPIGQHSPGRPGNTWPSDDSRLSYPSEASMARGQCGFTTPSAEEDMNGVFLCWLRPRGACKDVLGIMTLTVFDGSYSPLLKLNETNAVGDNYMEGQTMTANCTVHSTKPPAFICLLNSRSRREAVMGKKTRHRLVPRLLKAQLNAEHLVLDH